MEAIEYKRRLLIKYPEFKNAYEDGKKLGLIEDFSDKEWEAIKNLNDTTFNGDFYNAFTDGLNIGKCGFFAKTMSYAYDMPSLVSGRLRVLVGTPGAPLGEHWWFEAGGYAYDTTLLIKVKKEYLEKLGYSKEFVYDYSKLNSDLLYNACKSRYLERVNAKPRSVCDMVEFFDENNNIINRFFGVNEINESLYVPSNVKSLKYILVNSNSRIKEINVTIARRMVQECYHNNETQYSKSFTDSLNFLEQYSADNLSSIELYKTLEGDSNDRVYYSLFGNQIYVDSKDELMDALYIMIERFNKNKPYNV